MTYFWGKCKENDVLDVWKMQLGKCGEMGKIGFRRQSKPTGMFFATWPLKICPRLHNL
jgi:hypothetical protein